MRGPRKSLGGGQQLHGEPCHHYLQQPGPGQAGDTGSLWLANSWQQVGPSPPGHISDTNPCPLQAVLTTKHPHPQDKLMAHNQYASVPCHGHETLYAEVGLSQHSIYNI